MISLAESNLSPVPVTPSFQRNSSSRHGFRFSHFDVRVQFRLSRHKSPITEFQANDSFLPTPPALRHNPPRTRLQPIWILARTGRQSRNEEGVGERTSRQRRTNRGSRSTMEFHGASGRISH